MSNMKQTRTLHNDYLIFGVIKSKTKVVDVESSVDIYAS